MLTGISLPCISLDTVLELAMLLFTHCWHWRIGKTIVERRLLLR